MVVFLAQESWVYVLGLRIELQLLLALALSEVLLFCFSLVHLLQGIPVCLDILHFCGYSFALRAFAFLVLKGKNPTKPPKVKFFSRGVARPAAPTRGPRRSFTAGSFLQLPQRHRGLGPRYGSFSRGHRRSNSASHWVCYFFCWGGVTC